MSRNAAVLWIVGTILFCFLAVVGVAAVGGIAYWLHCEEVREQDRVARKYIDNFRTMFEITPPELEFRGEPHPIDVATYERKLKAYRTRQAAMDREIRDRWGVSSREFVFRYYQRHPWLNRLDPLEFESMLAVGRITK